MNNFKRSSIHLWTKRLFDSNWKLWKCGKDGFKKKKKKAIRKCINATPATGPKFNFQNKPLRPYAEAAHLYSSLQIIGKRD